MNFFKLTKPKDGNDKVISDFHQHYMKYMKQTFKFANMMSYVAALILNKINVNKLLN